MFDNLEDVDETIQRFLNSLHLVPKKMHVLKEGSFQYVIQELGTVICGLDAVEYSIVVPRVESTFTGYKIFYIAIQDDFNEKKDEIIWELTASGYMHWLRFNFYREFKNLVMGGFGTKIINERAKRLSKAPKFTYWAQYNELYKNAPINFVLSHDVSFFDFMPEKI